MKTWDDILNEVKKTLDSSWEVRDGRKIPESTDIKLDNDAVKIECAILYADMRESTKLVQKYKSTFAAKIYKSFLLAACDVIRNNEGVITSFDGDRVMAAFYGNSKCSDAAKTGLQICAIMKTINEEIVKRYPTANYRIDYATGIDVSELLVIRTGIRGSNDLAWIGVAANNAAKLSELRSYNEKTFITKRVFDRLNKTSKYNADQTKCMWRELAVRVMGEEVLGSSWSWSFK